MPNDNYTEQDLSELIKDIAELPVMLDERYFKIADLPEIRKKIDNIYNKVPVLTANYKTIQKMFTETEKPKDGK